MIAGCETADAAAWSAFVADYTPLFLKLSRIYVPRAAHEQMWAETLKALSDEDFNALRGFERQSEREFLVDLRAFHLRRSATALNNARGSPEWPELTAASIASILKGVPLVHQEVIFLKLAGYCDATLEKLFRITPSVAAASVERLKPAYAVALSKNTDEGWQPAAWLQMLAELWNSKAEACPPLRLLIRLQDGHVGWQEKEPAEKRVAECLHCLETWTALKELVHWRANEPPAAAAQVESLVAALPVRKESRKPLFKRWFG